MAQYRFFGVLGSDVFESSSDLLALARARYVTGRPDVRLFRRSGDYWSPLSLVQMLYGPNARENLLNAFGSASARTLRKAEHLYADADADAA